MPNNQFDINVNNGVAIVVENDARPVKWMEVFPSLFNQSKSLLYANIEMLVLYLMTIDKIVLIFWR